MSESSPKRFDPPASFWLILVGASALLLTVAWLRLHPQIASIVIAWKHAELRALHHFTGRYDALDQAVVRLQPSLVTVEQVGRLFTFVGEAVNVPAALILLSLAVLVYFRAPSQRFRKPLDAEGVFAAQGEPFRCAGAYLGREQLLVEPRIGNPRSNDFSFHTWEWIESHAWDAQKGFQERMCREELARQLGPVWTGVRKAEPHARCLFAAFALHSTRERDAAVSFLGDFAHSLPKGDADEPVQVPGPLVEKADAILADPALIQACAAIADRHAFQTTALMSVLQHARDRAGVLAPAQFNGVKLVDRRLWYALHSLGMPNPYAEAIGARDHWTAERLAGVPLHTPSIDRAVRTVKSGLSSVRRKPVGGTNV